MPSLFWLCLRAKNPSLFYGDNDSSRGFFLKARKKEMGFQYPKEFFLRKERNKIGRKNVFKDSFKV